MVCVGLQQTAQGPGGLSGLTWGDPAAPQKTCPRLNPKCETDANLGCALAWSWLGLQRRVGSQLTARGQRRPSPPARRCAWSGPHCPSHLPCDAASEPQRPPPLRLLFAFFAVDGSDTPSRARARLPSLSGRLSPQHPEMCRGTRPLLSFTRFSFLV